MRLALPPIRRSRIPLTALVDVVFILLFFFMLAAQPMNWRVMQLMLTALPSASVPAVETRLSPNSLTIVVLADGGLYLRGEAISLEDVLARLETAAAPRTLRIVPGRGLSMQQLVDLLDRVKPSGVSIQLMNPGLAP